MNYELLPNEEIKQITGFPNYFITSFGRVWSTHQGGHWLVPTANTRGNYKRLYVSLGANNKKLIHRLVAEAFIANPNNYPDIDHIDGDATNNNKDNLRWSTQQTNMANPITNQRVRKNGGALYEIEEIDTHKLFWGYAEAAAYAHVHEETIRNHTKNKVQHPKWRLTGRKRSYLDGHVIE